MKRYNINKIGLVLVLVTVLSACKKLDLLPQDRFTDANYWTTADKANNVLNTAYSQIMSSGDFFFNEAMSDNAFNGRGDNNGVASIAAGTYDPSLGRFKGDWGAHYGAIKTSNIFLENVDRVPNMDATLKARMKAEARFLRAWHYFMLETWWGDVPLIQKDITIDESKTVARTPKADVVSFILKELDDAAAALPANTTYAQTDRGRVTKGAAIALKARVLLYESRWADVVTECEKLIGKTDNGTYALFSTYGGIFAPQNEYNSEVIFDLEYMPTTVSGNNRYYTDLRDMVPISVGGRLNALAPTQELVDSYLMTNGKKPGDAGSGYNENNPYVNRDPRLTYTIVYHNYQWDLRDGTLKTIYIKPGTDPNQPGLDEYVPGSTVSPTGYYVHKYYDRTSKVDDFGSGINLILIRYADVLMMYAEAKTELGQMNASIWSQTVGALRSRAGFTDANALSYPAVGQSDMREIVRNERRVEFALEGLRVFDIRRWKIAENVLNGWAHGAKYGAAGIDNGYIRANLRTFDKNKNYLWPIPRDERAINPNLTQNPGW
ncbi:RagB/SusD family nutrient uptake outer membrane protein [Mucilaginibacter achroorhodeus]|uniref:RagB/SusD family nutrient uptake outer membrane protein n=1 Tax=Mucilaginibacter achroorhodeus TaxID=2599294 RepID=A0A563U5M7_9SPHI|nr:RagB/SusD family nutrient uptake outer membrane protein [Mucilaginibacter achroorhodeus]TWR26660.1 RagB/SusD family nutrient uptake outer membrane protein [Mucilaginibacter achroorhodeus]